MNELKANELLINIFKPSGKYNVEKKVTVPPTILNLIYQPGLTREELNDAGYTAYEQMIALIKADYLADNYITINDEPQQNHQLYEDLIGLPQLLIGC